MISYTTLAVIILLIAGWRIGWGAVALIAVSAVSIGAIGQLSAAGRGLLSMLDHAVIGVDHSSAAVGLILPVLGWG